MGNTIPGPRWPAPNQRFFDSFGYADYKAYKSFAITNNATLLGSHCGADGVWSLEWRRARFCIRQFITLSSGAELPFVQGVAGVYSEVRRDEGATGTEMAGSRCDAAAIAEQGYQSHLPISLFLGASFWMLRGFIPRP